MMTWRVVYAVNILFFGFLVWGYVFVYWLSVRDAWDAYSEKEKKILKSKMLRGDFSGLDEEA